MNYSCFENDVYLNCFTSTLKSAFKLHILKKSLIYRAQVKSVVTEIFFFSSPDPSTWLFFQSLLLALVKQTLKILRCEHRKELSFIIRVHFLWAPETSKTENSKTLFNSYSMFAIVAKLSILDICRGPGCGFSNLINFIALSYMNFHTS